MLSLGAPRREMIAIMIIVFDGACYFCICWMRCVIRRHRYFGKSAAFPLRDPSIRDRFFD